MGVLKKITTTLLFTPVEILKGVCLGNVPKGCSCERGVMGCSRGVGVAQGPPHFSPWIFAMEGAAVDGCFLRLSSCGMF